MTTCRAILLVGVVACATPRRRGATAPVATGVAATTTPPMARILHPFGGGGSTRSTCLRVTEGDVQHVVLAGERFELRGREVLRATQRFSVPPQWMVHDGAGWHFFAREARWFAHTFLGDLELLRASRDGRVGRGVGRSVVVEDGVLMGMDVPGTVIDAAFIDERRGLAVVEPGVILETLDGGRAWRHLPIADEVNAVLTTAESFIVGGAAHAWRYDDAGAWSEAARNDELQCDESTAEIEPTPRPAPPLAPSRTIWRDEARGRVIDVRSGVEYDLVRDTSHLPEGRPCEAPRAVTSAGAVMLCDEEDRRSRLHRQDRSGRWQGLTTLRACGAGRCVASQDGARVACEARCDPSQECDGIPTACVVSADRQKRERRLSEHGRSFNLVGLEGDEPLWLSGRRYLRHLDFVRGDDPPRRLCPDLDDMELLLEPGTAPTSLARDGRVRISVRHSARGVELIEAEPGVRCAVVSPPPGVTRRVLWCGGDGRALAHTAEGWHQRDPVTARWTRSETANAVMTAAGPLESADRLQCGETGAWMGEHANGGVVGWGSPSPSREDPVGPEPWPEPWLYSRVASWRCERAQAPASLSQAAPPPQGVSRGGMVQGSRALWFSVNAEHERRAEEIEWLPLNSNGFPRLIEGEFWYDVDAARDGDELWMLVAELSAGQRLWQLSRARPAALRFEFDGGHALGRYGTYLAARSGVAAVLLQTSLRGERYQLARIAEGRQELHDVMLSTAAPDPPTLVLRGGGIAFARWTPDGSLFGGAPRQAPSRVTEPSALAPCGPGAEGTAVTTIETVLSEEDARQVSAPSPLILEFGFEGDRLCLRRARNRGVYARFEGATLLLELRRQGALHRLSCRRGRASP